MTDRKQPVILTRQFTASSATVWRALTERSEMVQWFFEDIPAFEPVVGFKTQFGVDTGERIFTHLWEITHVETERAIVYDWRYEEYPGQGKVEFLIGPNELGTLVTISNFGIDTFPNDLPEFQRESAVEGWTYFLDRLEEFLATHHTDKN